MNQEEYEFEDITIGQIRKEKSKLKQPVKLKTITTDDEKNQIAYNLIKHDIWDEKLLSSIFEFTVDHVLTRRERFVLEMKVDGKTDKYLIKILKRNSPQRTFSAHALANIKSEIKKKLKDGYDKQLPGWLRNKVISKKEKDEAKKFYENHPEFLEDLG